MTKHEWYKWVADHSTEMSQLNITQQQVQILLEAYRGGAKGIVSAMAMYDGTFVTKKDPDLCDLADRTPPLIEWLDSIHSRLAITKDGIKFVEQNETLFTSIMEKKIRKIESKSKMNITDDQSEILGQCASTPSWAQGEGNSSEGIRRGSLQK